MTTGPESAPDEMMPSDSTPESNCPRCGGTRYRGPFGETCPRCLLAGMDEAKLTDGTRENLAAAEERSGEDRERRFDHFEISLRPDGSWWELGRGGLGVTYQALDVDSLTPVALKLIETADSSGLKAPAFVFQQALEVAKIRNANVARLLHFGTAGDGRRFIVSQLVEGQPLSEFARRAGPLPASLVLEVAAQIAQALLAAGEHRIHHGNLHPANVMLIAPAETGRPIAMVLDFAVADWFRQDDTVASKVAAGRSFDFASPEKLAGRETDARADFYSLGATLCFLFSGIVPKLDAASNRVHFTPLRERGVPEVVITWLRRLLDPNPAGRPRDAFALVDSLNVLRATVKQAAESSRAAGRVQTTRWWKRITGGPPA